MTEGVEIRRARWPEEAEALRSIRHRVFVDEQQVPEDVEWDDRDDDAIHFIAVDHRGEAIGTGRLLPEGQIGRMAVLAARRGFGIGRALLDAALAAARDRGDREVFLNAQVEALPFYEAAGFHSVGSEFVEAGIRHQRMECVLGIPFQPETRSGKDLPPIATRPVEDDREDYPHPSLAESSATARMLSGEAALRDAIVDLAARARNELLILSPDLDPLLFDNGALVEALSAFARRHPRSRVEILVHDVRRMVRDGNRVLSLVRRLPTSMSIRVVDGDMRDREDSFVLADRTGLVVLPRATIAEGFANHNDAPLTRQYADVFRRLADRAVLDPNLRIMTL
ncbi:MAG: GNAT family N-acetyltransferase [Pseudomonadales bacterium]|jgi:predicted GNAT family N-acyltransferase|nr:GNAT family N-acetyltransferase [Pseudomonadales bacterium]